MGIIKTISANMKNRREELLKSQGEIANMSNMPRQAYGRLESGKHDFKITTLESIAKALEIDIHELLKERT